MSEINIENIDVSYSNKKIIEDLCVRIPSGGITTIIGPNGCGKSTLLKALGRILRVDKGTVYLDCKDIHRLSTNEVARKMAILPQSPSAPEGMTVEELISYGRFPYQRGLGKLTKEDAEIIKWAIEATNLHGFNKKPVESLSGGERQRAWIAMALAQQTDIILLDEPTTYLDMSYQLEVLELLEELNREHGATIVMVLHDINLAARFANYLIALKAGRIIKTGTANEVISKDVLQTVFNIDADIVIDKANNRPICLSYKLLKPRKEGRRKYNPGA